MDISISVRKMKLAFSLCKMTINDEMNDHAKLNSIVFVELLEFIGRLAQLVFKKNETMKLFDKIILIMQKMFELIPEEVRMPTMEYEVDSETDDEEYHA
jgi:hypothetical protein